MSDERIEKLEKSLAAMRKRVDEVDRGQREALGGMRFALLACTVAGGMLALTATNWRTTRDPDASVGDATTLWGMVPEGWQAVVTFLLVLVVAIGTISVFLADTAGRTTHLVFTVLAVLVIVSILFVGKVQPAGWFDPDEGHPAPGRWLTALASLVLAVTHGIRASEVNR
jgi:hypothetical protein